VSNATATQPKRRNWGRKRWIGLVLIGLGVYFGFYGPTFLRPISPTVSLPAEPIGLSIAGFAVTNTMIAALIADLVIVLMAFGVWRLLKNGGGEKPTGWYNFVEWIIEFLWNTVSGVTDGKWAKRIFPWTATIFILVLTANLTKAIPGFEAFGLLKPAEAGKTGYPAVQLFGSVYSLDKAQPAAGAETYEVVPFLRGAATDLNFTFALAIVTMVVVQAFGVWAQGPGYFGKFINIRALLAGDMLKAVDFGVGLLELISEVAKILSFAFRLFGNIFAGALLLSIIGVMMTVAAPAGVMLFEVFVGALQAYVFALLATVFMSQSVVSHHAEEKH
jgi:F-type H+-transporting ATPase subunit a